MNEFDVNFADIVANMCFKKFSALPKSGKPISGKEWTLLAAIVQRANNHLKVVSLATGTKCIGRTKMSDKGDVINDSHAEVLCRRGFMRYLFEEIKAMQQGKNSNVLFSNEENKYAVRDGISFHLFTTHVPCGDASIFPKEVSADDYGELVTSKHSRKRSLPQDEVDSKKIKYEDGDYSADSNLIESNGTIIIEDINRTGAKSLPHDPNQDEKKPGKQYHVVGTVRTKPGRGDPTLSVSCSDKILRWNCVGIEGALLSIFLSHPIYLTSIIVSSHPTFYNESAMKRAIICRNEYVEKLCQKPPHLLHASVEFEFNRRKSIPDAKPSACGIVWCDVAEKNHEVCVEGRRLGWTKKKSDKVQPLFISKKCFLDRFKSLITGGDYSQLTYFQIKKLAIGYCQKSEKFKSAVGVWTVKNHDLLLFK